MKKNILLLCILVSGLTMKAQMRTLLGFSTQFNPQWLSDSLTQYTQSNFYLNSSTHKYDSVTFENRIFKHNGKIDSILNGIHYVIINDTMHLDTFFLQTKSVGTHYTDSSVFIDYNYQSQTFTPTYRLSVSYVNGKIKNYYSEYHQTTGWDGQMNLYAYKYDGTGKYLGADYYTKSITGPFIIAKTIKRTYSGNTISSDSIFFPPTTDVGVYTYLNPTLLKLTSFRNNVQSPGYTFIDFDINSKAKSYFVYQGVDTPNVKIIFTNKNTLNTSVGEVIKKIAINIYPNPTSNEINILSSETINRVEIYNLTGIRQITSMENRIDVSNLSPGIYFIKAYSSNNISTQKFIKQ